MMPAKKYQLTDKGNHWHDRGKQFGFQVGWLASDGKTRVSYRKCPHVFLARGGIVSTANELTQLLLEQMIVPQNTRRNSATKPAGKLFVDVTASGDPVDVDLDLIFAEAEG